MGKIKPLPGQYVNEGNTNQTLVSPDCAQQLWITRLSDVIARLRLHSTNRNIFTFLWSLFTCSVPLRVCTVVDWYNLTKNLNVYVINLRAGEWKR